MTVIDPVKTQLVEPGGIEAIPVDSTARLAVAAVRHLDRAEPRVRHDLRRASSLSPSSAWSFWQAMARPAARQLPRQPQPGHPVDAGARARVSPRWCWAAPPSASGATSCPPASTRRWPGSAGSPSTRSAAPSRWPRLTGMPTVADPADHRGRARSRSPSSATTSCSCFERYAIVRARRHLPHRRHLRSSPHADTSAGGAATARRASAGSAGSRSRSARPSATRPDGTRTPPTTPATCPPARTAAKIGVAAGLGNFVSCTVLMIGGRRSGHDRSTSAWPTTPARPRSPRPRDAGLDPATHPARDRRRRDLGERPEHLLGRDVLPRRRRPDPVRAAPGIVALGFGVLGFVIALLRPARRRSDLRELPARHRLLDRSVARRRARRPLLRRGTRDRRVPRRRARSTATPPGFIALVVASVVSIWLFSNQTLYAGARRREGRRPEIGDLTALVGFVLAAVLYVVLFPVFKPRLGGALRRTASIGRIDAAMHARERRASAIYVTDEEKLAVAAEQARIGAAEGGIPIGAALFDQRRAPARQRPQPAGAGRRRRRARRDRRVPQRGPAALLPRHAMVDDPVALLVLLGPRAPVRHRSGRGRRGPELPGRPGLDRRARHRRHRASTTPS